MKEHFRKIDMPAESKFILLLDNCTTHTREFDLPPENISVPYLPPNVTLLVQPMDQGIIQNMKCFYRRDFLCKRMKHEETTIRLSANLHYQRYNFQVVCPWNSVKTKNVRQAWRKLWPAVTTAEGASDEEDFAVYNVRSKDTVREMLSMFFETLDAWNPDCEIS